MTRRFSVSLRDLALELQVDYAGLRRRADHLGIERRGRTCADLGTAHRRMSITREDAQALRDDYAARTRPAASVPHWPTAAQAAAALGLTVPGFKQRRLLGTLKVASVTLTGVTLAPTRYDPADVRREAARLGIRPRATPHGAWSSTQMREMLGLAPHVPSYWRERRGCPAHKLVSGDLYWWPHEVEAWMLSQRHTAKKAAS